MVRGVWCPGDGGCLCLGVVGRGGGTEEGGVGGDRWREGRGAGVVEA